MVDAIGVLVLSGLFVSHMSGNSAALGAAFGQGDFQIGLPHLFAIPVFIAGLFAGYYFMEEEHSQRRCAVLLLAEAICLVVFLVLLLPDPRPARYTPLFFLTAAFPLFAMGMQNASLRSVGRSLFPSTYVTGVLDSFAKSLAQAARSLHGGGSPVTLLHALRAGGVWAAYVCGAITGSAGLWVIDAWVVLLPVTLLLAISWWLVHPAPA